MTKSQGNREIAVMISSTTPSTKYSCSRSPLILAKGSTAIDGLSGNGSAGPPPPPPSPSRLAPPSPASGGGGGRPGRAGGGVGEGRAHPVDPQRPGDVLYLPLTQILKGKGQP